MCNYRVHYIYNDENYFLDFSISGHVGAHVIESEAYRQILRRHKGSVKSDILNLEINPIEIW